MFTLKFFQYFPDDTERHNIVAATDYEIVKAEGKISITANGEQRYIDNHGRKSFSGCDIDDGFNICFIENEAGKTIDRIVAGDGIKL